MNFTASSNIEGITVSVSVQISSASVRLQALSAEVFDENEVRQDLSAALAPAVAAALAEAELKVSESLLALQSRSIRNLRKKL